jgi:hypothetical protein
MLKRWQQFEQLLVWFFQVAKRYWLSSEKWQAIADPLSEPEQKADAPCLPNLELLSFAIADPFSGLTNAVESSCLLVCDRTQTISRDSMGDIGFGITAKLSGKRSLVNYSATTISKWVWG